MSLRSFITAAVAWAIQLGIWFCYTANDGWREIAAGAVAATLATIAAVFYARVAGVEIRFKWRWIAQAWRLPGYLVSDTAILLRGWALALVHDGKTPGGLVAIPFDVGGDDPYSSGRRALEITFTTLTPNSVVVGIVAEQGRLLHHQIIAAPPTELMRELGAGS